MDIVKKIKMGSEIFFSQYQDFKSKDTDWLCLVRNYFGGDKAMRVQIKHDDIVLYHEGYNKADFIKEALTSKVPMKIGKFLIPEFSEYFNVTLKDLKLLKPLVDSLDSKHAYQKIIYDAYISNGSFTLTDEQRQAAYDSYKSARQ